MEKPEYTDLEMKIVFFEAEDLITTSGEDDEGGLISGQ